MQVLDSTLERALLSIYDASGLRAGGLLSVAALQRAWERTGLRNSDFRDAVRILLRRGLLEVRDRPDAMDVVLTPAGAARLQADAFRHPSEAPDLEDLRTLETARARAHARRQAWAGGRRRRNDDQQPDAGQLH
ncbi:hypothetical protein AAG565_04065 [Fontimonas sp. SYSU GA230001]|uniref:hypothetical protein n=1 Tax=Fontimonas sp. SYSU GA230001 TaxID=3142450 RepID=UPI0032B606AC